MTLPKITRKIKAQIFVDDDHGYLSWLHENPTGFVVNADRPPNASCLRLTRATCQTISGEPATGRAWTVTSTKACGVRREVKARRGALRGQAWGHFVYR